MAVDHRTQLQAKAAKYRRYVRWINDPEIAQTVLELALELERKALQPDEEDIRTLAYDLWVQAGEPDNRDREFWLEAERLSRDENESSAP